MITNFKELPSNSQTIINALKDLNILDNNNEFQSQQQISIRLQSFFENAQQKSQFLKSLFKIFEKETQEEGNLQKKLKLLLLLHILLSSSIARSELSKIFISKQINIQINNTTLGKVCQQYYFYLYKLASQTTFINEDVINGDILIYFTLSNQCNLGISIQSLIEDVESFQNNQLIGNIVKSIYYDLQNIAIFIIKDVKSLIENQHNIKQNKLHILELYKECQVLQQKMLGFYRFNRHFSHFNQIMPPFSLIIEQHYLKELQDNKPKIHSLKHLSKLSEEHVKFQPQTSKQRQMIQFEFVEKKQQQESPQFSFSN
ncbi:unnamed protein product [Paramecium primaurelia]|uniref:Uncharacterized protein n=1 Tax=Paramecium primaurelia TaxID=5886 RepID=A0A8S1LP93_PARPR|nr:unnamed protein product [Paramecium primaurelia]